MGLQNRTTVSAMTLYHVEDPRYRSRLINTLLSNKISFWFWKNCARISFVSNHKKMLVLQIHGTFDENIEERPFPDPRKSSLSKKVWT